MDSAALALAHLVPSIRCLRNTTTGFPPVAPPLPQRSRTPPKNRLIVSRKSLGYSTSAVDSTSTTPLAGGMQDAQTPPALAGSPPMTLSFGGLGSSFAAAAPPAKSRSCAICPPAAKHAAHHHRLDAARPSPPSTPFPHPLLARATPPFISSPDPTLLSAAFTHGSPPQVRSTAKVPKATALGDLSDQIEVGARGEILDLKNTVNGMVVRLRSLTAEVTHVTLEVGSQGKEEGKRTYRTSRGLV
ncbi:hypothetical protein D9611_015160 [Ephemerocybe angulata]|uniref:HAMP domain-containing protein n=1 Tax=Ephemerocybe angulata TaxID=980116 RepID=A0A8H5AQ04_9AGAR|nr:hypothetical protein D9611_015160 [Tulosesus angulatus]